MLLYVINILILAVMGVMVMVIGSKLEEMSVTTRLEMMAFLIVIGTALVIVNIKESVTDQRYCDEGRYHMLFLQARLTQMIVREDGTEEDLRRIETQLMGVHEEIKSKCR